MIGFESNPAEESFNSEGEKSAEEGLSFEVTFPLLSANIFVN